MRETMNVECLYNPLCELAEGPLWHAGEQTLYWTDINGRGLWRHIPGRGRTERVWQGGMKVGGFAFRRGGGFVLCTDKGIYTANAELSEWSKLHDIAMSEDERFNDITTDPQGRLFAGTMKRTLEGGTLYRIERGRVPAAVLQGIGISNGMTFSLDERTFFHTDSRTRRITVYDYDAASGNISGGRLFYQGAEEDGSPDGITMDREGCIWAACWGGSQVIRLDGNGKIVRRVAIPAKQPSSVMFGGNALEQMYVTSAHEGSADPAHGMDGEGNFLGGHIYLFPAGTTGRPEWEADVG